MNKLDQLRELLRSYGSCLVAYSGGVDSAFLAYVAHEVLGKNCLAVIADTPSLPRRELREALAIAERYQLPLQVVTSKEFSNQEYLSNPLNRCYFCKNELFTELVPLARQKGLAVVVCGENASDVGDFRPGQQAAAQYGVKAPLKEVGMTKLEIRQFSAQLGLPTAEKPQMACLSSRIPYGEPVTLDKMQMIEAAENYLRDLGFHEIRVRHHELKSLADGQRRHLARIELGSAEMVRILTSGTHVRIAEEFKKLGYAHATLDLLGYRRGSVNEGMVKAEV
jgi:pyridinium-3,5-biscarboxylic acid mononucleotide sulfurtransferase